MILDGYARLAKHAGRREPAAMLDALATLEGDPVAIADTLRRHHLLAPIRAHLPEDELRARLSAELVDAIESRRPIQRVPLATMMRVFDEVRVALEAARVPVLLLKGFYFAARLYGGADGRPQHDVDVLVRSRDFRAAVAVLRRLAFSPRARDLHSRTFTRAGVAIDVHHALRRAPALRLDEEALWCTARDVEVDGLTIRTLSDEYTLALLVLASFEDLGQGAAKLKQLLDTYLLLREIDATTDWEQFFAGRARENLLAITVNVFAVVTELFEAGADLPRLCAALDERRPLQVLRSRAEILALVAAPPKHDANLTWFGRIYPGSMAHYLVWFWYGGFPANLAQLRPAWLRSKLRLLLELGRVRRATARGGV